MRTISMLAFLAALATSSGAGDAAAQGGYVVRVDSSSVYLDLGSNAGVKIGQAFGVYSLGDELKHPVTGASLGPLVTDTGRGTVFEVQEKYSVGRLTEGTALQGERYKLITEVSAAPAQQPPAAANPDDRRDATRSPYARSPILDLEAVDIAAGDVDGDGAEEAVVADKTRVLAYALGQGTGAWTPSCSYSDDRTGTNFLSIDTADLDHDGKAEVFATLNSTFFERTETLVLVCEHGKFSRKETIPALVRSYAAPDGTRALATQGMEPTPSFPLSAIRRLEFSDGRYAAKDILRHKRLDWLSGFGLTSVQGRDAVVFYDPSDHVRVQADKWAFVTPEKYGQTSNRMSLGDKTLYFRPRLLLESGADGLSRVITLRNVPKFFALASSFGLYDRSELHWLRWNGMALERSEMADIPGYSSGLAELHGPDGRGKGAADRLMAAVVGAGGKSAIWFFEK